MENKDKLGWFENPGNTKWIVLGVIIIILGVFFWNPIVHRVEVRNLCEGSVVYQPAGTGFGQSSEGYYTYTRGLGGTYGSDKFKTREEALKMCVRSRI